MAKIMGFNNIYTGLPENEAWQKIYEFGKNLMPIKERELQKKYNRIFSKVTKVIRDDTVKKINTERLVPEDIIILSKGDYVPVDAEILEDVSIEFDEIFKPNLDKYKEDISKKVIYQGMRVKRGKAIVRAIRTGDDTYLGEIVKQIDNKNYVKQRLRKEIHKYFNVIGLLGLIFMLFGTIFSLVKAEGTFIERISLSVSSGLLLFLSVLPIGSMFVFLLKLLEHKKHLRKSNLIIKKYNALLKSNKISVVCIDDRFLEKNHEECIQKLYRAGITIVVISEKRKEEIFSLAENAGIFEKECNALSGEELEKMQIQSFNKAICDTVIYYEVNSKQKAKILEGFKKLNIKTIGIVDQFEEIPTLEYVEVGICSHHRKKSLDFELADGTIIGTELSSIYELIKGSYVINNYFRHYVSCYILFQLPIVVSLLIALLGGIKLNTFYIQTTIFIIVIIPLLLMLLNKHYDEDTVFEINKENKKFIIKLIKAGLFSILVTIIGLGFYIILDFFNISDTLKISFVTLLFTFIDSVVVKLQGRKRKAKNNINKNELNQNKDIKPKNNSHKQPKIKKAKKKGNIEDIRDEIM